MALQFNPESYFQAYQAGQQARQQNMANFYNSISQVGQGFNQYQVNQRQRQMQALQNQLTQQEIDKNKLQLNPLVSPGQIPSGQPDMSQSGMTSPTVNDIYKPFGQYPGPQPSTEPDQSTQEASAGMPDTGFRSPMFSGSQYQPSIVDLHNQHLRSQGLPGIPSQQQSGSTQQGSTDFEAPYLKILRDPTESPIRQQMAQAALDRVTKEALTPYEIPKAQAELQKLQGEAKAAGGVDPQDMTDAQNGNWNAISSRHNGVIPPKIAEIGKTMSGQTDTRFATFARNYQPQIQKKQDEINAIDSSIQGIQSGDAGQIESAQGIVSTALKLSPRLAREAGGQSYMAELNDWASGKLGNQSIPPELMKPLVNILNLQKNSSLTGLQQIKQFALNEGRGLGIGDNQVNSLFSGIGNSSTPVGRNYIRTATNPKTGQKIGFNGTNWVPLQ